MTPRDDTRQVDLPRAAAVTPRSFSYSVGSVRTAILDTDYILNKVVDRVQLNLARMFEGPPLGIVRSFASSHVLNLAVARGGGLR
jgi:hypothetical protein